MAPFLAPDRILDEFTALLPAPPSGEVATVATSGGMVAGDLSRWHTPAGGRLRHPSSVSNASTARSTAGGAG